MLSDIKCFVLHLKKDIPVAYLSLPNRNLQIQRWAGIVASQQKISRISFTMLLNVFIFHQRAEHLHTFHLKTELSQSEAWFLISWLQTLESTLAVIILTTSYKMVVSLLSPLSGFLALPLIMAKSNRERILFCHTSGWNVYALSKIDLIFQNRIRESEYLRTSNSNFFLSASY